MKTIHNSYLFTEKDGDAKTIIEAVSKLPREYPAFIVSSDLSFLEKTTRAFAMSELSPKRTRLYKINIDADGYFAFLRPADDHFDGLYDSYQKAKNESDKVKILSDMLELLNECIAVFSSLPLKQVEYMMGKIADQEESSHPSMYIPLGFIFTTPPFKAAESLISMLGGKPYYYKVLTDFLTHSKEWLYSNHDLTAELLNSCSTARQDPSEPRRTIHENINITTGVENSYLGKARDNQDYLKRIKILAAVNADLQFKMFELAIKSGNAMAAATHMFLLTRSMAQFSANKAVEAGLRKHADQKEGGKRTLDRKGLLELIRKYHSRHPQSTDRELWEIIKNDLKQKNARPCKGYTVQFYDEHTGSKVTDGELIQKNPNGLNLAIKFEAFTDYRKEVRK